MLGTVALVQGGRYEVEGEDLRIEASLRGRLKSQDRLGDRVVIGDRVLVEGHPERGFTIEEVLPRRNQLVRRGAGGRGAKVLAANLDHLLIVVSARSPDVRQELIDRLLVIAEASGVPPSLVINKMDLPGAPEVAQRWVALYHSVGYPVHCTSATTGLGLEALEPVVCAGSSALIGPSGVGKSSLLNALDPELDLRTRDVSWKTGRGRHTTVTSRLIPLGCGGRVADTPGIGDVGLWGVEPNDIDTLFPEFDLLMGHCRFRGCSHVAEPECAVRVAVEDGTVDPGRFASYLALRDESLAQGG